MCNPNSHLLHRQETNPILLFYSVLIFGPQTEFLVQKPDLEQKSQKWGRPDQTVN